MPICGVPAFTRLSARVRRPGSATCSREMPHCSRLQFGRAFYRGYLFCPPALLASSNMKDILAELREQYDHIVVDTPPALSVTDAVVMSTRADAVVLVIRSGQTT